MIRSRSLEDDLRLDLPESNGGIEGSGTDEGMCNGREPAASFSRD